MSLAPERGAADLLLSQRVGRQSILVGQCLGLFVGLTAAEAIGFGAAGLVIFSQAGGEGAAGFLLLNLCSALLAAVFLALAALLAAGAVGRKRTRALALALVTWFVAIVRFDVAALGIASLLPSGPASRPCCTATGATPGRGVSTPRENEARSPMTKTSGCPGTERSLATMTRPARSSSTPVAPPPTTA